VIQNIGTELIMPLSNGTKYPGEVSTIQVHDAAPVNTVTMSGAKGSVTEPSNPPTILSGGGPDGGGYRWKDSNEPGGPAYNWVDITTVGTMVTFNGTNDDSYTASAIPMGMTFNYYGLNYTNVYASTNGFLSFASLTSSYASNAAIPVNTAPNAAIYAEWDDLYGSHTTSHAYYYHDVAGNRFILSWVDWDYYYSPFSQHSFQIILNGNDNSVVVQYGAGTYQALSTEGIENEAGTIATQVAYNSAYLTGNKAIKYYKPTVWLSTDLARGVVTAVDPPHPFNVIMSATQLPVGSYIGGIAISSNDIVKPVDTLLVNFTVNSVVIGVAPTAVAHTQDHATEADYPADFTLSNTGTTDLIYTATNTKPWITLSSYSGDVAPGGTLPIDIHVNTAGLLAGIYTDSVTFTSNDPYNPIVRSPRITITVLAPTIGVAPTTITRSQETDVTMLYASAFAVSNTGTSVLNWTAGNTLPWVTLGTTVGSVPVAGNQLVDITVNTNGIAIGSYPDIITINSNDPANPTKTIHVTVNVSLVTVNPDHITLTMIPNEIQTLNVSVGNGSAVPVRIDLSIGATPWLTTNPTADTIPAHGNVQVQVLLNTFTLTNGVYHGVITIHSSNLTTGVVVIPVDITVVTPSNIVLYPFALTHTQESGNIVTYPADFTIYNIGTYPLIWTGVSSLPWITLPVASGSVPGSGSQAVDVRLNTTGITPGVYSDVITINSNDPVAPTLDIPLTVTVSQIAPAVDHLDFTLREREVQAQDLVVDNGSALDIQITLDAAPTAWLSVAPAIDTIPAHSNTTAHVTVNATALTAGNYSGTITIHSSNVGAAVIVIPINVTVTPGGCDYVIGDVNNNGSFNGVDVVYAVSFFKGGPAPLFLCECVPGNSWYVAGDVNASCNFNGVDVTYMVSYFKGGPLPVPCADCPPAHSGILKVKTVAPSSNQ
jgi:hypothetical protein